MNIKLVFDLPYIFIESEDSCNSCNSICAISPYDANNTMNGLYTYKSIIGVDDIL